MKKVLEIYKSITQSLPLKSRKKRPNIDYIMNKAPLEEKLYWLQKVSEFAHKEQQENMKRWAKIKKKTI